MSAERVRRRKDAEDLMVRAEIERATAAAWAGVAHGLAVQGAPRVQVLAAMGLMDHHQERGDRWARVAEEWLQ